MTTTTCDAVATNGTGGHLQLERRSLLGELVSKGVRLTAQRKVVVEIIQNATSHLDAAALLEEARKREPSIDRATVYRTIDLLKRLRLVDELDLMHLNGEKHYYEVKTRRDHLHLACFQCGRIEEFMTSRFEELKAEISSRTGFQIQVARLEVGGQCGACRDSASSQHPCPGRSGDRDPGTAGVHAVRRDGIDQRGELRDVAPDQGWQMSERLSGAGTG
ncbi:MAG TPA: Fur family transcriptional regulator [Bryobacteraceae bacterium]|nr:Fur family transcriptional regulator [Bryobacteraceae bacterium]